MYLCKLQNYSRLMIFYEPYSLQHRKVIKMVHNIQFYKYIFEHPLFSWSDNTKTDNSFERNATINGIYFKKINRKTKRKERWYEQFQLQWPTVHDIRYFLRLLKLHQDVFAGMQDICDVVTTCWTQTTVRHLHVIFSCTGHLSTDNSSARHPRRLSGRISIQKLPKNVAVTEDVIFLRPDAQ